MKKHRNLIKQALLAILIFAGLLSPSRAQTKKDSVESFLKQKMKMFGIPGLQVAIVQRGEIIFSGNYGLANIEYAIPVTNQTVFSIASATKSFTGIAIMQLVEQGLIDLSAPVSHYLDSLPASWQPVTIKQLLTHVSGIPNIIDPATSETIVKGTDAAWAKVKTLPMEFPAGQRFSYNQTNYVLLGKIIDKLSGLPFSRYIIERQFNVVGMPLTARSGFTDTYDIVPGRATLYTFELGRLTHNFQYVVPPFLQTGSGINSTAEELGRWLIALQRGQLFKSENTLKQLWTPGNYNDGQPAPWALGWPVKNRAEHFAVGGYGGIRSAFFVYPADDLAIIVLTNLAGANPETFIDDIAGIYIPDMRVANGFGLSTSVKQFRIELLRLGFDHIREALNAAQKKNAQFKPEENDLNKWAYALMADGELQKALAIFKLNVTLYPGSWNVYDSYGEALVKARFKEEAIRMYKKSVELNPKNAMGAEQLKKLQ